MSRSYFDHNATTPVAPEVCDALAEALRLNYGNPSSMHAEGQAARQMLETARRQVATAIGASAGEIVFTSGGTEANNLAILGLVRILDSPTARKHVITTAIEHPSVLEACRQLEREGVDVTRIAVDEQGLVKSSDVEASLRPETVLVSVMHANNEIGTIQPVEEIARVIKRVSSGRRQITLHSDGVQAVGRIPVDVAALGVDMYSVSAHKVYAPKGTGALFVRKGVALEPLQFGGRHERERRAGTENVPGAAAFGRALSLAQSELTDHVSLLRDRFEQCVLSAMDGVSVNGSARSRLPNTSNLFFEGVDGEALVIALDMKGFAVSSGAACSSGSIEPSHVILALGKARRDAKRCVRFSFGRYNTASETDGLAEAVIACVQRLRAAQRRKTDLKEYARA